MQQVQFPAEPFVRAEEFDCRTYVIEHYGRGAGGFHIEVEFQAALYTVQQKIPASYGSLTATPTGVLFQCRYDDVAGMGRYLMALNLPFVIHHPPELREALLHLAEQMVQIATRLWLGGVVSLTRDRSLADRLLRQVRSCCQPLGADAIPNFV